MPIVGARSADLPYSLPLRSVYVVSSGWNPSPISLGLACRVPIALTCVDALSDLATTSS